MIKFTHILKEESSINEFGFLDNPTNRRLLNVVNKQIPQRVEVSHEHFHNTNADTEIGDIINPIRRFLRDTLFITDQYHRGQLIWLLLLNGNIDYLKEDIITEYKGYLYEMGYFTAMEEDWNQRNEECYDCDVYGTTQDECTSCLGSGEEESGETDDDGNPIMIECPECEGSGEMENDCDECGGSGEFYEDYEEYSVELWEMLFLSKDNIPYPSTLHAPQYKELADGGQSRIPALTFPEFMDKYRNKIINIQQFFVEEIKEEYEAYVEDEADNVDEFRKYKLEEARPMRTLFDSLGGR